MMRRAVVLSILSILLIVPCMAMLTGAALPQAQPEHTMIGGFPPELEPGIMQCWSSFTSIEGCVLEIYESVLKLQIGMIGPACCKAITEVNDKCWPKIFPINPDFPPMLKDYCLHKE
ncbi:hypothetical protein HHK36_014009 [Tetracentron sinense]|uniref:Prolamin-like domain-containing protein n=1 Tax=Tetracentron sinense TaxID=13715 RepID=A0A834Z4C2_TETSI|nr:hypothetical protein HHK36_014009 [Tetracentron sinense]